MNFKLLKINQWQQLENIDIEFHDRLTVLTGANGSGKTTILNLLARHAGWNNVQLATPKMDKKAGIFKFLYRHWNGEDKSIEKTIGKLIYNNGHEAIIQIPEGNSASYQIKLSNQTKLDCFYIPSHGGSIFRYENLENIPTQSKNKQGAFDEVNSSIINRYQGGGGGHSESYFMKNSLIGWAIRGYGIQKGNKNIMPSDLEQASYYEGFQKVLKKVLPKSLGFKELEIRNMEIVFICNDGRDEFLLETASGGISALIHLAWEIYMFFTKERKEFTVLIDEVENHLHPTMQRQILPDLLDAFPETRFVVATHSPLVVGSVKESYVYALQNNDVGKIESKRLDFTNHPKTAAEILDEVLGVSFTMPIWAEKALDGIINKYTQVKMDDSTFDEMRKDLKAVGLEKLMPKAIADVVKEQHD